MTLEKRFNKVFSILVFLYFVAYWPVERGKYTINEKFYIDALGVRFYDYLTIFYLLNYIMFALSILGYIILIKKSNEKMRKFDFVTFVFLLFFTYILFSLFVFNDYLDFHNKIRVVLTYYLIIFIYLYSKVCHIDTFKLITYTGITNSLLIIVQVILNLNKINSLDDIRKYRFSGGNLDPIIVSILLIFTYALIDKYKVQIKINPLFIKLILIFSCFLTGSRTWLVLITFYYVAKIFSTKKRINIELKKLLLVILIISPVIITFIFNFDKINIFINNYYNLVFVDKNIVASNDIREFKRNFALALFKEKWLFGIGSQSYSFAEENQIGKTGSNPHNVYLQILCENGIVGFTLFILLIVLLIMYFSKKKEIIKLYLIYLWLISAFFIGLSDIMGLLMFILIINFDENHKTYCGGLPTNNPISL